ncbi:salicylate hydroxylase [Faunimonas pinastri]|uniref:Salicylate hydroxylase n=1 Tax=Faunimonas pinastri TaxID=1855383 RepID=A0A1H9DDW6_9HYPH|nr:FAD-dependent monooxygenase [Faunimonas pinastri]SEQ10908.1 salicylate hydroxylase [Faunimonas pinastri]
MASIAIAGAGIAGLAAAIALAREGHRVDLHERAEALTEVGAGIQLSPNAMAILRSLRLDEAVLARAFQPACVEIHARNGRVLNEIPLGERIRERYGAPYAVLHRADLQAVLLEEARQTPGLCLSLASPLAFVRQDGTEVVYRAGETERTADILIAADGVNSRARADIFGRGGPTETGYTAWRAVISRDRIPYGLRTDVTGLWFGEASHLVHYPVKGGSELNLVAIARSSRDPRPPLDGFAEPIRALKDTAPAWIAWPLRGMDASEGWVQNRVALAGDAAHAMVPSAAQGGAQAIEDAAVLTRCLSTHDNPVAALAAYDSIRRPRATRIAAESLRNLRIYGLRGPAALARDTVISTLPGRTHLSRLDWLYSPQPG